MSTQIIPLTDVPLYKTARIQSIRGGFGLQRKLRVMGIREGERIKLLSRQPLRGPLTIHVCGCQMTLGRGMARHILVEVIE